MTTNESLHCLLLLTAMDSHCRRLQVVKFVSQGWIYGGGGRAFPIKLVVSLYYYSVAYLLSRETCIVTNYSVLLIFLPKLISEGEI